MDKRVAICAAGAGLSIFLPHIRLSRQTHPVAARIFGMRTRLYAVAVNTKNHSTRPRPRQSDSGKCQLEFADDGMSGSGAAGLIDACFTTIIRHWWGHSAMRVRARSNHSITSSATPEQRVSEKAHCELPILRPGEAIVPPARVHIKTDPDTYSGLPAAPDPGILRAIEAWCEILRCRTEHLWRARHWARLPLRPMAFKS